MLNLLPSHGISTHRHGAVVERLPTKIKAQGSSPGWSGQRLADDGGCALEELSPYSSSGSLIIHRREFYLASCPSHKPIEAIFGSV